MSHDCRDQSSLTRQFQALIQDMLEEQGFEHHDVTAALGVIAGICAGYDDQCFNHSFAETIMEVRGVQIKKDDSCLN